MNSRRHQRTIRHLREQLVEARRGSCRETVGDVMAGIRELGERGYRCCLVDYERFRTSCYVRVLGFEKDRTRSAQGDLR